MTAKEMFKLLDWKRKTFKGFIVYKWKNEYGVEYQLTFCKEHKCVEIQPLTTCFMRLTLSLNTAIQKQIEELGWNND